MNVITSFSRKPILVSDSLMNSIEYSVTDPAPEVYSYKPISQVEHRIETERSEDYILLVAHISEESSETESIGESELINKYCDEELRKEFSKPESQHIKKIFVLTLADIFLYLNKVKPEGYIINCYIFKDPESSSSQIVIEANIDYDDYEERDEIWNNMIEIYERNSSVYLETVSIDDKQNTIEEIYKVFTSVEKLHD